MTEEKNNVEDIQENIVEEENVEDKDIFDAKQLEEEKRESNDFRVEHNNIDNQINIQGSAPVNIYVQRMKSVEPKPTAGEKYNICKEAECIKFVEKYKNTDYFLVAFILCVFEMVEVSDLSMLKECLAGYFPTCFLNNKQETNDSNFMCNPFLSLDSIVSLINGKYYEDDDKRYIGLGENYLEATRIVFEQFPDFREILISFLDEILRKKEMHEAIYRSQMAKVLKYIRDNNLLDFDKKVLPILYENPRNVGLFGLLFYFFYEDSKTCQYAKKTINTWLNGVNKWLWKSACIVYVYLKEAEVKVDFEGRLVDELVYRIRSSKRDNYVFMAESLMYSKPFQVLMGRVLSKAYKEECDKKWIIRAYINLVRYCYYRVNKNNVELALVVCDTKEMMQELEGIIIAVMANYEFRLQIYFVLQAYIKELEGYVYSPKLIKYLAAYCHALSNRNEAYLRDIIFQLKKTQNSVTKKIIEII